jgi:hypothetical protein
MRSYLRSASLTHLILLLLVSLSLSVSARGVALGLRAQSDADISWFRFDPPVVPDSFTDPVTLTLGITGGDDVRLELAGGGEIPLTKPQPFGSIWSVRLEAAQVLFGYTASKVNHNFVGHVAVRENGQLLLKMAVFALVSDANIPEAVIWQPASDMIASDHVVNIHWQNYTKPAASWMMAVAKRFYEVFPDDFDFLNFVYVAPGFQENRFHYSIKNEVQGIGLALFDQTAAWGSKGRLMGVNAFPIPSYYDGAETGATHEICHQWINHLDVSPLASGSPHWPAGTQARGVMGIGAKSQGLNFSYELLPLPSGHYKMQLAPLLRELTDLDLYLMGLIGPSDVGVNFVFSDPAQAICNGCSGPVTFFTIDDVINGAGPRIPDVTTSPKEFRVATLVVSQERALTELELAYFEHFALRSEARIARAFSIGFESGMTKPFHIATKGLGTLDASLAPRIGASYCQSSKNSTGGEAVITAAGSTSLAENQLVLTAQPVPNQTFLFFHGTSQSQLPFGNGTLCIGSPQRILPPGIAIGNVATRHVDLTGGALSVGGTQNFQCWFRDSGGGGAAFDTSDAVTITFVP